MLSTNTKRGDVVRHVDGDLYVIAGITSKEYLIAKLTKEFEVETWPSHVYALKTNPRLFNTKLTYKL